MILRPASELTPLPNEWLWPGYLAVGSLAILDGDPGQGKSLVTLDLAARLTTGRPWPNGAVASGPASVLFLCAEDVDSIIVTRLRAHGADLSRIFLWPRHDDLGLPRLPHDLERLDQAFTQTAARLVVIDPIIAFLDGGAATTSDASVRRALTPLTRLADAHRCAVLLVRHLTKRAGVSALYRGGGSIGIIAASRLTWLAAPDPGADDRIVLSQSKNNYAPLQPSLAYSVAKTEPLITWHGPSPWTAEELASRRPRPSRRRAREFLRLALESGPRLSGEIQSAARENGFSRASLRRAKSDLGIRNERIHCNGRRFDYWLLKEQELLAEPSATPGLDDWLRRWKEMYPEEEAGEDAEASENAA